MGHGNFVGFFLNNVFFYFFSFFNFIFHFAFFIILFIITIFLIGSDGQPYWFTLAYLFFRRHMFPKGSATVFLNFVKEKFSQLEQN